ncbi:SWI-SNF complex subunit (Snf5) [Micractinium conductrix]|uniref:SWI-SNF complex subunit (Snf5) n=1 Tax=Micractinium conductrix TaxID=554055 RepID=A0A2P6V0W5_9CHLO|nr:SWI-SNF complex subunit (Snf5) [Micractinium conductrix]|eukprot:PSC67737.1 SWI-SNF complex subunit (Snf5) [Micractinium conductrix]
MAQNAVLTFLEEAGVRKRPAPSLEGPAKRLLPLYLQLEHGAREAREQLLWRLGDTRASPAAVARAFVQQYVQQPQQLEREAQRLQRDLERSLKQHEELATAPPSPTLVRLEVRVTLPHLDALFYDDPVWDLGAPRAASEAYVAAVAADLKLDWHAHTLILRKMKDCIDAATRDLAAGKAQVLATPSGAAVVHAAPSRLPQVFPMNDAQKEQLRQHLEAAKAARRAAVGGSGGGDTQQQQQAAVAAGGGDMQLPDLASPSTAAAVPAQIKQEEEAGTAGAAAGGTAAGAGGAAAAGGDPIGAPVADGAAAAAGAPAANVQPHDDDMPDLPDE